MSRPQFIEHTTNAGERWDLVAWQYYGDAARYSIIIMANPGVPIEPVFEAGVTLAIPIIEQQTVIQDGLPPWKRSAVPS